jgi:SAM-dependent methyltransferase
MAGFYQEWIMPTLVDLSMHNKRLVPFRQRVAGAAEGRVLDIGIGSGLNLPFYGAQAREIFGLDPSPRLIARPRSRAPLGRVHFLSAPAERIALHGSRAASSRRALAGSPRPSVDSDRRQLSSQQSAPWRLAPLAC